MQCCQSRAIRACVTLVGVESSYLAVEAIKWNNSSTQKMCACLDISSNCMCMGGNVIWLECESPFIATKQVMMNEYVVVTHLCPPDLMVIWSNRLQTTPSAFTDNHHERWNGRQVFFLVLIVSWDVFTALISECSRTRCMTHTHTQGIRVMPSAVYRTFMNESELTVRLCCYSDRCQILLILTASTNFTDFREWNRNRFIIVQWFF